MFWISLSDIARTRFANSSCINTQGRDSVPRTRISNTNAPECYVVATVSWKIRAVLSVSWRKPPPDPPSWQLTVLQFAHHWLIKSPFSRPAPNRHIPRLWMLTTTSLSEPFSVDTIALSTEQGSTVNTSADFICKTQTTKKKLNRTRQLAAFFLRTLLYP